MTTQQTDPAPRNEAEQTPNDHQQNDHQQNDHQQNDHQQNDHQQNDHQQNDHQQNDHQQNDHRQNDHGREMTNADPIDESIDESMAEADRANGEGDPDDARIQRNNGQQEDKPKAMRRAD